MVRTSRRGRDNLGLKPEELGKVVVSCVAVLVVASCGMHTTWHRFCTRCRTSLAVVHDWLAAWSSGMIPAQGARDPGFNS